MTQSDELCAGSAGAGAHASLTVHAGNLRSTPTSVVLYAEVAIGRLFLTIAAESRATRKVNMSKSVPASEQCVSYVKDGRASRGRTQSGPDRQATNSKAFVLHDHKRTGG